MRYLQFNDSNIYYQWHRCSHFYYIFQHLSRWYFKKSYIYGHSCTTWSQESHMGNRNRIFMFIFGLKDKSNHLEQNWISNFECTFPHFPAVRMTLLHFYWEGCNCFQVFKTSAKNRSFRRGVSIHLKEIQLEKFSDELRLTDPLRTYKATILIKKLQSRHGNRSAMI